MNPRSGIGHAHRLVSLCVAAAVSAALTGCGGNDNSEASSPDLRFKAQAATRQSAAAVAAELSAAERQEVQQRSREWASASLLSAAASNNGVTLPPLYFGQALTLQAAAQGDTLLALRAATGGPSAAVAAALQQGLQRTVSAGEDTALGSDFFKSVTPDTLQSLSLRPLSAAQLALQPRLRASVVDGSFGNWAWPQVMAYRGAWAHPSGGWLDVAMLRVVAPTRRVDGSGYTGQAMALPGGHWLLKIEPTASLYSWGAAELNAALLAATLALTQPVAVAALETTWDLPVANAQSSSEMLDRRGMALAQDPVNANLRSLDGGGSYAELSNSAASMSLSASGLGYSGSQTVEFVFSPLNVNGPAFAGAGQFSGFVGFGTCPLHCGQPAPLLPGPAATQWQPGHAGALGQF